MDRKPLLYYLLREGLVGHARAMLEDDMSYGEEDDVEYLFWKGKVLLEGFMGLGLGFQVMKAAAIKIGVFSIYFFFGGGGGGGGSCRP